MEDRIKLEDILNDENVKVRIWVENPTDPEKFRMYWRNDNITNRPKHAMNSSGQLVSTSNGKLYVGKVVNKFYSHLLKHDIVIKPAVLAIRHNDGYDGLHEITKAYFLEDKGSSFLQSIPPISEDGFLKGKEGGDYALNFHHKPVLVCMKISKTGKEMPYELTTIEGKHLIYLERACPR